jgi:hypothetical protein
MSTRAEREAERLLEKIRQAGVPVPDGARFQATYASRSMRNEGGAVWILVDTDGRSTEPLVCSQWPRRYLLTREIAAHQTRRERGWIIDPAEID